MSENLVRRQEATELTLEVVGVIEEAMGAYGTMTKGEIFTEVFDQAVGINMKNLIIETDKALDLLIAENSLEINKDHEKGIEYYELPF